MRALGVVALLLVTLAGLWGATEYVAAELRYAPELGPPWAALGDVHVYAPWAWVEWGRRYGSRAPALFRKAGALTTLAAVAGVAVAALAALGRKPSGASQAHGSSRWATTAEMRGAGLLREALDAVLPDELERWLVVATAARHEWKRDRVAMAQRRPLLLRALERLYSSPPQDGQDGLVVW